MKSALYADDEVCIIRGDWLIGTSAYEPNGQLATAHEAHANLGISFAYVAANEGAWVLGTRFFSWRSGDESNIDVGRGNCHSHGVVQFDGHARGAGRPATPSSRRRLLRKLLRRLSKSLWRLSAMWRLPAMRRLSELRSAGFWLLLRAELQQRELWWRRLQPSRRLRRVQQRLARWRGPRRNVPCTATRRRGPTRKRWTTRRATRPARWAAGQRRPRRKARSRRPGCPAAAPCGSDCA